MVGLNVVRAIAVLPVHQEYSPKWVYWYLRSPFAKTIYQNLATTSVQATLNLKELKDIVIPFPPPKIREQIVEILSSIENKIELNLEMNKILEEMAMAIYRQWFVDFGPFKDGEFVNSELGEIPKGWGIKEINDITNLSIGRTPPRKEKQWFTINSNDYKWISIKDMGSSGPYIVETSEYLTNEAISQFNIPIIPENTVILSFKLTVGRVSITTENMLSNEAIAHLKLKQDFKHFNQYIYLFLKDYNYSSLGSTSSIATAVNSKMIRDIKIIVPNNEALMQFNELIKPLFDLIKSNIFETKTVKKTRDYLLPKLISGEIRVKEAEGKM